MTSTPIRMEPTPIESAFVAARPHVVFGYFIKTPVRADDLVRGQQGTVILEPSFKLIDGYGMHVASDIEGISRVLNAIARDMEMRPQCLLLRDANGQIPVYSLVSGRPVMTNRLSVPSPRVGEEEGPSEFCLPKPDRECSYC